MRIALLTAAALAACEGGEVPGAAQPGPSKGAAPVEQGPPNAPAQRPAFERQTRAPAVSTGVEIERTVIATGLERPWGIAFLPDGRALVTEKPGRLRVVTEDGRLLPPVSGVPQVVYRGQGGLLDVAVGPAAAGGAAPTVCLSYAEPRTDGSGTAVACGRAADRPGGSIALAGLEVVFRQQPSWSGAHHFGSRIVFDGDGSMFVTTGERNTGRTGAGDTQFMAQRRDNGFGKVMRVEAGGGAAKVWSYGHRNIQSAALDAGGQLWTVEHGPKGGDELNRIQRGTNYGWPVISYGIDYDGTPVTGGETSREGMAQPVYYWDPVIAPSGMIFYSGALFPEWRGNAIVGGLVSRGLVRLELAGGRVRGEERIDLGARIRDVEQGPDGAVYVLTDEADGKLIRLARADGGARAAAAERP